MSLKDYFVPSEFYSDDEDSPYAETVEDLIEQLQRLPPDLPVKHGFDHGCRLTVYNIKQDDVHLEIGDAGD